MNLIIDIGNTRAKVFLFDGVKIVRGLSFQKLSLSHIEKIFARDDIEYSILSSVKKTDAGLKKLLNRNSVFTELTSRTPVPFKNKYKTKETLGRDRIANAAGAIRLFPGYDCLVIDAGTCVKYDFVNAKKEYIGGAISPGMLMRYRSLHNDTAKLPLIRPAQKIKYPGTTTSESIIAGVQRGIANEMNGYIMMHSGSKQLQVILTGGDAGFFARHLNFPIFAAPDLTATGLNEILQHNHPAK